MDKHAKSGERQSSNVKSSWKVPRGVRRLKAWLLLVGMILGVGMAGCFVTGPPRRRDASSQETGERQARDEQPAAAEESAAQPLAAPIAAVDALKKEELEVARQLVRDFPNSADPIGLLGMVHQAHGNTAEAVKCWESCLELNPDLAGVYNAMGRIALERGEHEKAVRLWRKPLEINPAFPGVHNRLAHAQMDLGKPKEAIATLEKGTKIFPRDSQGYFLLGQAYMQLNEHRKAKENYERAIAIRADHRQAHYALAIACARLGQMDKSREHMATFKNLKGKHRKALSDRADAFDDLAWTRRSLARTHTDAGQVYLRHRDARKAEEHWRRAAALDPRSTLCRMELASLFRSTGRKREALDMGMELKKIDPRNAVTHLNIGILHAELKQYDAALAAIERAMALQPGNPSFRRVYELIKNRK